LLLQLARARPESANDVMATLMREAAITPHKQSQTRDAIARVLALQGTIDDRDKARAVVEELRGDPVTLAGALTYSTMLEPRNQWFVTGVIRVLEEEALKGAASAVDALGRVLRSAPRAGVPARDCIHEPDPSARGQAISTLHRLYFRAAAGAAPDEKPQTPGPRADVVLELLACSRYGADIFENGLTIEILKHAARNSLDHDVLTAFGRSLPCFIHPRGVSDAEITPAGDEFGRDLLAHLKDRLAPASNPPGVRAAIYKGLGEAAESSPAEPLGTLRELLRGSLVHETDAAVRPAAEAALALLDAAIGSQPAQEIAEAARPRSARFEGFLRLLRFRR
jgi:hypothetical protein